MFLSSLIYSIFELQGKTDSGNLLICFADYWSNTQIWQDRYATLRQIETKDKYKQNISCL